MRGEGSTDFGHIADHYIVRGGICILESDIISRAWPEWKTVRRIGRGSYGIVYEAVRKDYEMESHAAVKVISIPQDASDLDTLRAEGLTDEQTRTFLQAVTEDFIREIRLMETFKGVENIVSVEDYKVLGKQHQPGCDILIRMELLTPFNTYISDKKLTEEEAIRIGIDIASALELCEQRNVIHRDVKPENIFVSSFGSFKLGDFGVARGIEVLSGGLSQKGSLNYMAPEMEHGEEYDSTVDIYSLGIVLYKLLNNNRLPFLDTDRKLLNPEERAIAAKRRLAGEALPPPSKASGPMAEVILKACAPNPADRFQNASQMKAALTAISPVPYNREVRTRDLPEKEESSPVTESGYSLLPAVSTVALIIAAVVFVVWGTRTINGKNAVKVSASDLIIPDRIEASSEVEPYTDNGVKYAYYASYVYDGDLLTAWSEDDGTYGYGVGEYLDFYVPEGTVITDVEIFPGYLKKEDTFWMNSAPSKLKISSGGEEQLLDFTEAAGGFEKAREGVQISLEKPLVSDGVVRFTIYDVRKGTDWQDTSISELHLFGRPKEQGKEDE